MEVNPIEIAVLAFIALVLFSLIFAVLTAAVVYSQYRQPLPSTRMIEKPKQRGA